MGLFDAFNNLDDNQNQGLLAAAAQMLMQSGPSRTPTSLGQIAGGGLMAYQAGTEAAKRRKMEEQEAQQIGQMRGLQIRGLEGDLAAQQQAQERAQGLAKFNRDFFSRASANPADGAISQMSGPTVENAAALEQVQSPQAKPLSRYQMGMQYADELRAAGFTAEADAALEQALKLRPKYSTTPQAMRGKNGTLVNVQLAEDGSDPLELSYGVKPDLKEVRLGDRVELVDMNAAAPGAQYRIGQSPDSAASVGAQYAQAAATRDIATATRQAAEIRRNQETEIKLGDDYRTQSKPFKEVSDAYRTITSTLDKATTSPAATLAGATKFMKLLDPGSVVRESELGMALAATGKLDLAANYFNTLARGKVLTKNQVEDFKKITKEIYKAAQQGQQAIDKNYRQQAETYGLRPNMIVQDLGQNISPDISPKAIAFLKMNPKLRDQFDAKFGAGAAASVLGK